MSPSTTSQNTVHALCSPFQKNKNKTEREGTHLAFLLDLSAFIEN